MGCNTAACSFYGAFAVSRCGRRMVVSIAVLRQAQLVSIAVLRQAQLVSCNAGAILGFA